MVKLLLGEAGTGKTKKMLSMANEELKNVKGELVYIESSSKHMHQLHRDIRFISTEDFKLSTFNSIYGFLCGMVSENYDIQRIYIDGIDKMIYPFDSMFVKFVEDLDKLSDKYQLDLIMSASTPDEDMNSQLKNYCIDCD